MLAVTLLPLRIALLIISLLALFIHGSIALACAGKQKDRYTVQIT